MEVQVESGVIDPNGSSQPEGNVQHAPSQPRSQMDPRRNHRLDVLESEWPIFAGFEHR